MILRKHLAAEGTNQTVQFASQLGQAQVSGNMPILAV